MSEAESAVGRLAVRALAAEASPPGTRPEARPEVECAVARLAARVLALETSPGAGGSGADDGGGDVGVLRARLAEAEARPAEAAKVAVENGKLRYQVEHLKRALEKEEGKRW